jgi:hypothetical protein
VETSRHATENRREKLKFKCAEYYIATDQFDVDSDALRFYFLEIQLKSIPSFSPSCKQRNNTDLIIYI